MVKFLQFILSVLCSRRRLQPLVQNFFESDATISVALSTRAAVAPWDKIS
jgi:hypothetical protein